MPKKKQNQLTSITKEYKKYSKSQKSSKSPFFLTSVKHRLDGMDRKLLKILASLAFITLIDICIFSLMIFWYFHPIKLIP